MSPVPGDDSPRAQLLSLASQVRQTLIARFGQSMRARTTEEIAADVVVKEALGDERFEPLIRLLAGADRWKFAPPSANGQLDRLGEEISAWKVLITALDRDGKQVR
jgi:hypothetical protein